jgi:aspartate-semialdehyde dehydrogenase
VDVCFFAATTDASKHYGPIAVSNGAVVIDKSNAFRMDPAVPLVVPEVNAHHLRRHKGIIASPNCSTIQMVVALKPVLDAAGIERIIVSTYQSVSGTGKEAIEELRTQTAEVLAGQPARPGVYDRQIAFNLIAQIDSFGQGDYTGEEWKMVHETRKIFDLPGLPVTATCVRVPVYVSHSEAVLVETKLPLTVARAREVLANAPSVVLVDDPKTQAFSTPKDAEGSDKVFVSRVRKDLSSERGLWMWVVSDNLRKGAATNAVQIAESLVAQALL